nr:helix-turn-helix transcriptional regulator [Micromonospora citrea]
MRDQGFSDIAEGTIYALLVRIEQRGLVDVEKVPSQKGPWIALAWCVGILGVTYLSATAIYRRKAS